MVYMVVENFVDKMIKLVVIALNTMNQQLYWAQKPRGKPAPTRVEQQ
jgi:hypothetical protein